MSWIDNKKPMASQNPNFFKIGDVTMFVPVQNINISRHENYQTISYLRDMHAMRVNTGRSILRVDITFPVLIDRQLQQLQALVAMTRVTPFVPIQNKFLQNQLQIYDKSPEVFDIVNSPSDPEGMLNLKYTTPTADLFTDTGLQQALEALPMAILGMSVTMGGDSPDVVECQMSFTYWNPLPWFGIDLQYWKSEALYGLNTDYRRYLDSQIDSTVPPTFDSTVFRWWDVKLWSELNALYTNELLLADQAQQLEWDKLPELAGPPEPIPVTEDIDNTPDGLRHWAKTIPIEQFLEGLAAVESGGLSDPYSAKNHSTYVDKKTGRTIISSAAGRYQLTRPKFKEMFFDGKWTADGVPLKDKLRERFPEIAGPASNDPWLNKFSGPETPDPQTSKKKRGPRYTQHSGAGAPAPTIERQNSGPPEEFPLTGTSPFTNGRQFQEWYARPEMASVQTFIATEQAKGLYKEYDGDAVAAALDYFLGKGNLSKGTGAAPYIAHWRAHGTVKGFTKRDADGIGQINLAPNEYIEKFVEVLGGMTFAPRVHDDGSGDYTEAGGYGGETFAIDKFGNVLSSMDLPIISDARRKKLAELGWDQIALNPDGKPNTSIKNPLFGRRASHIIDLESGGILDTENQIVTSISMSFQNKFATLPVQGWPYPAMQHMGSIDSELRMTIACLSDSQQYHRLQQLQSTMHTMSARSRKYRANIHDALEVIMLNRLACTNRLINALGVKDVVLTDMTVQTDQDSTELARAELIMSESAFDPEKEKLQVSIGKNMKGLRNALRERWLGENGAYLQSPNQELIDMGVRLTKLRQANDKTLSLNQDLILGQDLLKALARELLPEEVNGSQTDFEGIMGLTNPDTSKLRNSIKEDKAIVTNATSGLRSMGQTGGKPPQRKKGLQFKSPLYITPTARVFHTINQLDAKEFDKIVDVLVPAHPQELIVEGLSSKITSMLEGLYRKSEAIPGDISDIEKVKGAASKFLNTSFGSEIMSVWAQAQRYIDLDGADDGLNDPVQGSIIDIMREFFILLAQAMHEWYNSEVLEAMLLMLYETYQNDRSFADITEATKGGPNVGVYRDLFLHNDIGRNPYSWLDATIEPRVRDAAREITEGLEARIDMIVGEYHNMLETEPAKYDRATANDAASARVALDMDQNKNGSLNSGVKSYRQGLANAAKSVSKDALNAAATMRYFSVVPFTMRRAFPAFRMYFVEEDNQGIIKRFDDFYAYNAINDIQIIKYKHRPSVMIVTLTNMFGHLDAEVMDTMSDRNERAEAIRAAGTAGRDATMLREKGKIGTNHQIDADGTESPLRDIMLKPGTKIVMKLGYDNDPDNLPTTFAGQVTEVTGGDVMTIVCMDWTSELFAGPGSDGGLPETEWYKRWGGTSSTWDLQGTHSARSTIAAVLKHRSVHHFGHWQISDGKSDPNYFGYRPESSWITKPWDNEMTNFIRNSPRDNAIANALNIFYSGDKDDFTATLKRGRSRALINIHPEVQPFYTAFGLDQRAIYPTKEETLRMTLWELIQLQRTLLPNHVALVRPYGQGDATLYFGVPYGVYIADEFRGELDSMAQDRLDRAHKALFREMIHNSHTVRVAGEDFVKSYPLWRKIRQIWVPFSGDFSDQVEDVPIHVLLGGMLDIMHHESGRAFTSPRLLVGQKDDIKTAHDFFGKLEPGASDTTIDAWYDLMNSTFDGGGVHDDEARHAILIDVQSKIKQAMAAAAYQKAINDPEFDPDGLITKTIKPVRRWHLVTAQHHIIANNIMVNSNFANEVRVDEHIVSYDRELTERRTRHADKEIPEAVRSSEVSRSIFMTSLLADEVRMMYRGQLILTGNAEIEPHDIIMIFDDVRRIHGAVEVGKVQHIFNQDMGFITIVEPLLIVEQGDYALSTALAATMTTIGNDLAENEKNASGRFVNQQAINLVGSAMQHVANTIGTWGTNKLINYVITQMLVPGEARNHPLTIYPLVKNSMPWIGGIEGASGRGVLGVIGNKVYKTLRETTRFVKSTANIIENTTQVGTEFLKTIDDATNNKGTNSSPRNLGN